MLQVELIVRIVVQLFLLASPPQAAPAATATPVDFTRDIRPILERRCQPCHFKGGQMHAELPFDRPETLDKLGTRLFSRIEQDEEQELIRKFLARH